MTAAESKVCRRFTKAAENEGWTVYPEVSDWDLVCVWEKDRSQKGFGAHPKPGDQLAVEAKGRCKVQALEQCIKRLGLTLSGGRWVASYNTGPDFAAIAAPKVGQSFSYVASSLDLHTYEVDEGFGENSHEKSPDVKVSTRKDLDFEDNLWTPPVVPDVEAGSSSPSALTPWRVQALKLCATFRARGWASTADFKRLDISKKIWRRKWMENDGREPVEYQGETRRFGKYVPDWGNNPPDDGWETERDRIMQTNPDDVPDRIVEKYLADVLEEQDE